MLRKVSGLAFTSTLSRGLPLILLAGLAAMSGYAFNVLAARFWGAVILGRILGALSAVGFIGLPASLIVLPAARWASQTAGWRHRLWRLQVLCLVVGGAGALLVWRLEHQFGMWLHVPQSSWWHPLVIWLVPAYLGTLDIGVLLGRRAYGSMATVTAIPVVGKLGILFLGPLFGYFAPQWALWSVCLAGWGATILGLALTYFAGEPSERTAPSIMSIWPAGWVNATVSAWLTWDTAVAAATLQASSLGTYAVVATIGKIPFHLTSSVANLGIGENGWGLSGRRGVRALVAGVGLAAIIGSLVAGRFVLAVFGLRHGEAALAAYMAASTLLAFAYFEAGADAQHGRHTWAPIAVSLGLWTAITISSHPNVLTMILELGASLVVGLVVVKSLTRVDLLLRIPRGVLAGRRAFRNWCKLLTCIAFQKFGFVAGDLQFITGLGTRLTCRNAPTAWDPVWELFCNDYYRLRRLDTHVLRSATLVVDVGAHVGAFALAICERNPSCQIVCYEPSPATAAYLRRNIEQNGLTERVRVIEAAVTDHDGRVQLWERSIADCTNCLLPRADGAADAVTAVSLDSIVSPLADGEMVDILKLDCEGAEFDIVLGSSNSVWARIHRVLLEYHPVSGHSWSELETRLTTLGFRLSWHEPKRHGVVGLGMAAFERVTCGEVDDRVDGSHSIGRDATILYAAQDPVVIRKGAKDHEVATALGITAVIPAFNERTRLPGLLDRLAASLGKTVFPLEGCVILDGGSTDGTAELAEAWATDHAELPVEVIRSSNRRGKAEELDWIFENPRSDIVLCLDADIAFDPCALDRLTGYFAEPRMAVAWGACRPDDHERHLQYRASAFQMNLTLEIQRHLPMSEPIAQGFFFALRPRLLSGFRYCKERMADDLQLVSYVRTHGLQVVQDPHVLVARSPSGSLRDFYRQTYRFYAALMLEHRAGIEAAPRVEAPAAPSKGTYVALLKLGLRDPIGGLLYVVYRLASAVLNRVQPDRFEAAWPIAESTKR